MVHFAEINQAPSPYSVLQHWCWKSSNTEACANRLSQILANSIDNGERGIGLRIYVRYCRCWIRLSILKCRVITLQFVIFNPWKVPWKWIAFYQNSFVLSPGLLYHLIRRDTGRLANETFTSNPIVSLKQYLTV